MVSMQAKPPEPAKEQSLILTEGQREGDIEVLQIDEKNFVVKVNTFGTDQELKIEAPKSGGAPAPGAPGPVGFMPPPPVQLGYTAPPTVPSAATFGRAPRTHPTPPAPKP